MRGIKTCFHKVNRCNLHPQCDNGEDEVHCLDKYKKKGLVPKQASFRCQSPHHNDDSVKANKSLGVVWIMAALNDGNPECWNEVDEKERSTYWESYGIPGLEP